HDESCVVEDRGIRLLCRSGARMEGAGTANGGEGGAFMALDDAVLAGSLDVSFNEMEQRLSQVFAGDRVVEDGGAGRGCEGSDDAVGRGRANILGFFAGGDGQR